MSLEHMQSVTIGGRAVKVGRLSNIGQAQHFIQQFAQEASKYNRVYISNIHSNISDEDIRAVFESFGKVIRHARSNAYIPQIIRQTMITIGPK